MKNMERRRYQSSKKSFSFPSDEEGSQYIMENSHSDDSSEIFEEHHSIEHRKSKSHRRSDEHHRSNEHRRSKSHPREQEDPEWNEWKKEKIREETSCSPKKSCSEPFPELSPSSECFEHNSEKRREGRERKKRKHEQKPKIFENCCPPQICTACEGKKVRIVICTNSSSCIKWEVSTDNGCSFCEIPWAKGPVLCFIAKKSDQGNLYRAVIESEIGPYGSRKDVECQVQCDFGQCPKCSFNPCQCFSKCSLKCGKCHRSPCRCKNIHERSKNVHERSKKCPQCFSDPCVCQCKWFPVQKSKCSSRCPKAFFICQSVRLIVKLKPCIIQGPEDQFVFLGEPVIFKVEAKPKDVKYQWRKNGILISGATSPKLIIPSVEMTDEGVYSVTVCNDCGSDQAEALLAIKSNSVQTEISGPATAYQGIPSTYSSPYINAKVTWEVTGNAQIVGPDNQKFVQIVPLIKYQQNSSEYVDADFTLTLNSSHHGEFHEHTKEVSSVAVPDVKIIRTDSGTGFQVSSGQSLTLSVQTNPSDLSEYTFSWDTDHGIVTGSALSSSFSVTAPSGQPSFQVRVQAERKGARTEVIQNVTIV